MRNGAKRLLHPPATEWWTCAKGKATWVLLGLLPRPREHAALTTACILTALGPPSYWFRFRNITGLWG